MPDICTILPCALPPRHVVAPFYLVFVIIFVSEAVFGGPLTRRYGDKWFSWLVALTAGAFLLFNFSIPDLATRLLFLQDYTFWIFVPISATFCLLGVVGLIDYLLTDTRLSITPTTEPPVQQHQPPPIPSPTDSASTLPPPLATANGFNKIQLKRRAQKSAMLAGKPTFTLDARVELSPHDRALVSKYGLGDLVVYDSKARRARDEHAAGHYQDAYVSSYGSVGRMTWQALKAAGSSAMAALSLRVTVNSLIKGQHISCKELDELLAAESAIIEACNSLKAYLETALTFDGRETLLEI